MVLLEGLALLLATLFGALMILTSRPAHPNALLVGLVTTGFVAVRTGLVIASILPQELEGTMALIGMNGVQMAIQPPSPVLSLYGPLRLMELAAGHAAGMAGPVCTQAPSLVFSLRWPRCCGPAGCQPLPPTIQSLACS